ncbi:MAG: sugar phosphate isomerase/epimerase [Anaerolineae bacterium]|nr:sugar phosphate isomerase/epimerase [Anaerolineae bacterium]
MTRTVKLDIGLNAAFTTRRWEEPENWMRLTAELGYPYLEFCGDVIDPFFSGDRSYQLRAAEAARRAGEKYGVVISDYYTGMATHRFHGLSHSDPSVRARMREWIVQAMDITLALGATRLGGHWDALSVEVLADPERTREAMCRLYDTFRELCEVAAQKGLTALYNEQMYIPSETPWTIEQAFEYLVAVNGALKDAPRVPLYLTIDVGHQAGMHYGATGDDLDYVAWLRALAPVSEVVHLQQTTPDGSYHWPFTAERNQQGHIDMQKVLEAIEWGHRHWKENRLYGIVPPVQQHFLILEVIPGSTVTEERLLRELKESAQYLRQFVPEGGLTFTVEV